MGEPHVAVARIDDGYFVAAGLALPGLSPESAVEAGTRGPAAYAEAVLAAAREVCHRHGLTLVLRAAFRGGDATAAVLVSGLVNDRGREADVRAAVADCSRKLARWGAEPFDRGRLDRELDPPADAQAVRLAKPDAAFRTPYADVPLISGVNTAVRFDRPDPPAGDMIVDWGLFPIEGSGLGDGLRRAAATSRVLAARFPKSAGELEQNAARATLAAEQDLHFGTALTVVCSPGAPTIRSALLGAAGGAAETVAWKLAADDLPAEALGFQVLDYEEERTRQASIEPDPRAAFEAHARLIAGGAAPPVDIFISYPRKRIDWVKEHVYEPLRRRGWSIFFDMDSIDVGSVWSSRLARGADECRVFLPVFCDEYWQSPFCKWEWGIAFRRDPAGEKGLIVPVLLDGAPLPPECAHVQAADIRRPTFRDDLFAALAARLG
jgi:hypothetical protein